MLDSIFIGTSGLQTFSEGLKVISNNIANLNTPGFKSSSSVFANLYYADPGDGSGQNADGNTHFGGGVSLGQTAVNFHVGELRQTGNPLDLNIAGEGFFIVRDKGTGEPHYTRAGQFEFNKDGDLVVRGTENQVVGLDTGGAQVPIGLNGLRINPSKVTTTVTLSGNLSSDLFTNTTTNKFDIASVKVIDSLGGEHALKLTFTPKTATNDTFVVKVLDGTTEVGSGEIKFSAGGQIMPGFDFVNFSYGPRGASTSNIKLDFSNNVTDFNMGSTSSLAVGKVDGYGVGSLNNVSFEADGTMTLSYSNGQKTTGPKVALARFDANSQLHPESAGSFTYASRQGIHVGVANQGGYGSIGSNQIEGSNVDLATEFSDLIVAQRGYQASSRIVSTANELLQDLFDMKGHR
ncbi:flagellar basal-body rod protein FlgF [Roseateles sp. NT4]|uniref:flagellar basal-body rod protein FlgF n=1 Tax=Roseateles sp. NT4 TaxID=3453715 RepID=UPI003EEC8EB8